MALEDFKELATETPDTTQTLKHITPKRTANYFSKRQFPMDSIYLTWKPKEKEGKIIKPPFLPKSTKDGLLTLDAAISLAKKHEAGIGVVIDGSHNLIGIDVDKVSLNDPLVSRLLADYPTYAEESPSGAASGSYRILYYVTQADKLALKSKYVLRRPHGQIELYVHSGNYLTITGKAVTRSAISEIDLGALLDAFPEAKASAPKEILQKAVEQSEAMHALNVVGFSRWAQLVPVKENNPWVKYVCRIKNWSHYDYWLYSLMAIHAIGLATNKLEIARQAAKEWSQRDQEKYDEDAFNSTWSSISPGKITLKTYLWIYKHTTAQWEAYAKRVSVKAPTLVAENIRIWARVADVKVLQDPISGARVLTGDGLPSFDISLLEDVSKTEQAIMHQLTKFKFAGLERDNVPRIVYNSLVSAPEFIQESKKSFIGEWALSKPWDGKDRIKWLTDEVIHYREASELKKQLYRTMIRKWLWATTKTFDKSAISSKHFHDGQEGLLILASSKGRVGKTEFGRFLAPPTAPSLYVVKSPDRHKGFDNDRDFIETIHNKLIVCLDEVNKVLTQFNIETLKEFITASTMWYRRAWGVGQEKVYRTFGVYATTNHDTLILPRDGGARRFWWIPVDYIDIKLMAQELDVQQLWAQAHHEMVEESRKDPQGFPPWVLSGQESHFQKIELTAYRAKNNFEEWLHDVFVTDREDILNYFSSNRPKPMRPPAIRDAFYLLGIPKQFLDNIRAFNQTLQRFLEEVMPEKLTEKRSTFRFGLKVSKSPKAARVWVLPPTKAEYYDNTEEKNK